MDMQSLVYALIVLIIDLQSASQGQYIEPRLCDSACYCSQTEAVVDCSPQDRIQGVPTNLPPGTRKLVIQGGVFPTPGHLSALNLSGLSHLTSLRIVNSQLRSIETRAFFGMISLRDLDLSLNVLHRIEPHTFYGLNLQTLYLQEQRLLLDHYNLYGPAAEPQPMLITSEAFYGLAAARIDLRGNLISDISFSLLSKVDNLEKLILSNNRIRQLDPKFSDYFDNSNRILDLTDNPLVCSCKLAWLVNREKEWIAQSPTLKTTCIVNSMVVGRSLRVELKQLSVNHLCMASRIHSIGVDVTPAGKSATLSCTAIAFNHMDTTKSHGGFRYEETEEYANQPVVRLRPPSVAWKYMESGQLRQVTGMTSDLSPDFDRYFGSGEDLTTKRTVKLNVSFSQASRQFTCITWDERERDQEVLVSLRGPVVTHITESSKTEVAFTSAKVTQSDGQLKDTDALPRNNNNNNINFLFQKQYTLLEMIGAVIGTFLVTLIVLLVGSRCMLLLKQRTISHHAKEIGDRTPTYDTKHPNVSGIGVGVGARVNGNNSHEGIHSLNPSPLYNHYLASASNVIYPTHIPTTTSLLTNPTNGHLMPMSAATPLLQPPMTVHGLQARPSIAQWPAPPGSSHSVASSHEYDIPRAMELSQVASDQATLQREQERHQQQQKITMQNEVFGGDIN